MVTFHLKDILVYDFRGKYFRKCDKTGNFAKILWMMVHVFIYLHIGHVVGCTLARTCFSLY